jgi:DNA repair protein RadA/Sms
LPDKSVWLGEVSLAGEIRAVAHIDQRLREAGKLGFERGYGPRARPSAGSDGEKTRKDAAADAKSGAAGLDHIHLKQLPNLVDRIMRNP